MNLKCNTTEITVQCNVMECIALVLGISDIVSYIVYTAYNIVHCIIHCILYSIHCVIYSAVQLATIRVQWHALLFFVAPFAVSDGGGGK